MSTRFQDALAALDACNAEDPTLISVDGRLRPAELVYAERMTAELAALYPDASEELRLAVRAQHLRRWTLPRTSYPEGRAGYHRWRTEAKRQHAALAGEVLLRAGYDQPAAMRVAALIRKENLSSDAEAQALEDAACMVFLSHYAAEFVAKHEAEKAVAIFAKTWRKMSERARTAAMGLELPSQVAALVARVLAEQGAGVGEDAPL